MKVLILFGCVFLSAISFGKIIINKDNNLLTYEISVDDITYKEINIENFTFIESVLHGINNFNAILYEPGKPEIPMIRFYVDGAKNINVKLKFQEKYFKKLDTLLKPSIFSTAKIPGLNKLLTIDKSAYILSTPYPQEYYRIERVGVIRGVPRYMVSLFPIKYIATHNTITGLANFIVNIELYPQQPEEKAGILFIVGKKFEENIKLQEYKALLNGRYDVHNIFVDIKKDTPQSIRKEIQDLYLETPFSHAIIIGDINDVPAYDSSIIYGMTDHYYRCLDEPYESDIGTPDIGIGRISVESNNELDIVLEKMIRYRTKKFSSTEWQKWLSFIASNDPFFWDIAEGTHNYAIDMYTAPMGFLGNFPNPLEPGGDKLYAITYSVSNAKTVENISQGRLLINYGGHGAVEYWADPTVTKDDVLKMSHPDAMPVVISNACVTGNFKYDSFAETWLRHKYGAIMFWGSIDSTYWDEDDILERAMYDAIFSESLYRFSEFTDYALSDVWRYYGGAGKSKYYFETYALFGDPEIELLTSN